MADIVRTDGVLAGEPRIDGTRVGVLHVYELVVEGDSPPVEIADQLDLSLGEVYSALAYYYEHPEEMRSVRQQNADAQEMLAREALKPPEKAT